MIRSDELEEDGPSKEDSLGLRDGPSGLVFGRPGDVGFQRLREG